MSRKNPASLNLVLATSKPTKLGKTTIRWSWWYINLAILSSRSLMKSYCWALEVKPFISVPRKEPCHIFVTWALRCRNMRSLAAVVWVVAVGCMFLLPFLWEVDLLKEKGEELRKEATISSKVENKGIDSLRYDCMDSAYCCWGSSCREVDKIYLWHVQFMTSKRLLSGCRVAFG